MSIGDIASVITAAVAAVGLLIAWEGLTTWRDQLYGSTDHKIAWQYLESTFKLRNTMNNVVRNPAIFPAETQTALEQYFGKENVESELQKNKHAANQAVYAIRWNELNKARKEMEDTVVQAEIWWGDQVLNLDEDLNKCIGKLFVNLKSLTNPDVGYPTAKHDVVYNGYGTDSNSFDAEIAAAVKKMEDFARPYLRKENSESIFTRLLNLRLF